MEQFGLKGFANSHNSRIVMVNDQNKRMVLVEGRLYMQCTLNDELTERIAVTQLYELRMGSREEIAEYEQIKEKLTAWGEEVGITSIRQVLVENGLAKEGSVCSDPPDQRELFHTKECDE